MIDYSVNGCSHLYNKREGDQGADTARTSRQHSLKGKELANN